VRVAVDRVDQAGLPRQQVQRPDPAGGHHGGTENTEKSI
jgi:hypothetical protein